VKKYLFLGFVLMLLLTLPLTTLGQISIYTSGFQVQNLDTGNAATIEITYYNQDGTTAASVSDTIAAGGSNSYFPLSAVPDGFNGSVVISSDREVRAIGNVLGNNGAFGASYGASVAGATTVYIPLLMQGNAGFNTWFNVQNTGASATDVTIDYSDGQSAGCTNLQPGAACTLAQSSESHSTPWVGSAVVTSAQPVAVTVMQVGPTTLFAYSGFTAGSPQLVMPLINANNGGYITGAQIQNQGGSDTVVTVSYTPSIAGTACEETLTIPAGQSSSFALYAFSTGANSTCVAGQKFVGSAEVTANSTNQPLVAIVNQLNNSANKGAAYEGVDPTTATDTVVMPLIMDRNANYFTGFSIVNVGSSATTVNCTFSGSTRTLSQSLAPGEALADIQQNQLASGYVGSATCTAASGGQLGGIVNELNSVAAGDAFLVYNAFSK